MLKEMKTSLSVEINDKSFNVLLTTFRTINRLTLINIRCDDTLTYFFDILLVSNVDLTAFATRIFFTTVLTRFCDSLFMFPFVNPIKILI